MIKVRLVTFYSYKGGVGRTMACANAAVQLARQHGRHVILVDWDLDAPGLHYYFGWTDEELADRPGLIDYLEDFRAQVRRGEEGREPELDRYLLDLKPQMARRLTQGSVRLMTCGRTDGAYMKRVQDFDWDAFYLEDEGFEVVEALKYRLREKADLALVDARAGQADIGATPTIQVPDLVVLLFATNRQNLHGTAEIARRLHGHPDRRRFGFDPIRMLMVPSRVLGSDAAYDRWLVEAAEPVYDRLVEEGVLSRADQPRGLLQCRIPVDPAHAFGESLPALAGRSGRSRLERAYADLAGAIDNLHQGLPPWPEDIARFEKGVAGRRASIGSKPRQVGKGHVQIPNGLQEAAAPLDTEVISALIRSAREAFNAYDYMEAKAVAEQALSKAREAGFPFLQAESLAILGDILQSLIQYDAASTHYREAIRLYKQVGNLLGEANCIRGLGDIALRRSDLNAARERYEQALPLHRKAGDVLGEANCIRRLGDIALDRSDLDTARECYEQALPLYRKAGSVLGEANCIRRRGDIALGRSDLDTARERYEQALPLHRKVGDVLGEANCIQGLGAITLRRSDLDAARERYEQALLLHRKVGDVLGEANCIQGLGDIAFVLSLSQEAHDRYMTALSLYARILDPYSMGGAHWRLARIIPIGAERSAHIAAARDLWRSIDRNDLIAELDAEFGPPEATATGKS